MAETEENLAQLRRVLRHLLKPNTRNYTYNTHNTKKHLLNPKKPIIPNYTFYSKLHLLQQTTPNYTKLLRTVPTTSNFTYYTKQHVIKSTTRNHTKLHLLHQHSPTTLTTPNYTYHTYFVVNTKEDCQKKHGLSLPARSS